jgi:DNA replication protein DnaC
MNTFDLNELKKETTDNTRYERRIAKLVADGKEVDRIKGVVDSAVTNVTSGQKSFVIYGEPQSGKTEMMIALTAKLLDIGSKVVIVLLNDSVQLLGQNLERFQRSGLSPSPKKFSELLPPEIMIGEHQWVIFCKTSKRKVGSTSSRRA